MARNEIADALHGTTDKDDELPDGNGPDKSTYRIALIALLLSIIAIFAFVVGSALMLVNLRRSSTLNNSTLTEDRVREIAKETVEKPTAEISRLLTEIQGNVHELQNVTTVKYDRLNDLVMNVTRRLENEERDNDAIGREMGEIERHLTQAGHPTQSEQPVVRREQPATNPTPPPQPLQTPVTRGDSIMKITFGHLPAKGTTVPVEFHFIRMNESGRVKVQRPDTQPNAKPEWLPVRIVRDENGVTWGVLSLPVLIDGEQLTFNYVTNYPARSVGDWGHISESTYYRYGPSGDGMALVVNPRAQTITPGTIR